MLGSRDKRKAFRILVADRNLMTSRLLAEMLGRKGYFNVVAAVVAGELLRAVENNPDNPDVVVMSADLDHDSAGGIAIAGALHARSPHLRTIMLADSWERELVVAAFGAGARGIFCRAEHLATLCKCIDRVYEGQIWADHSQVQFLIDALIASAPSRVTDARGNALLSGRELEVVQLAVKGFTNREIADKMKLSEHTVKNYMFRAFDKLGVSNRVEMLFYVLNQSGTGRRLALDSGAWATSKTVGELQEMAEAGSVSAQFDLGMRYRHGAGVEKNPARAYFWLRLADERAKDIGEESRAALQRLAARVAPIESGLIEEKVSAWLNTHRKKAVKAAESSKKRIPAANVL